jgi:hypothetical protein
VNGSTKIIFADPHKCGLTEVKLWIEFWEQKMEVASSAQTEWNLYLAEFDNPSILLYG